jgi:Flp pilus assembly protein TadD
MAKRSRKKASRPVPNASDAKATGGTWPAWLESDWIWVVALLAGVMMVYVPVWWAGYVWDDDSVLTENPAIIGPDGLKQIWTGQAADICPLTLTTFWVEYRLWGLAPLPYHLVNVLLHGGSAILLWRVLRALQIPGAWFGAALWAVHPVMVESVAWVSELKNTESGLFYLLSIYFFVRGMKEKNGNDGLMLLFAALALASKSSTVILPLVLCLCAWWMEGRWHWRQLVRVSPIFIMSIVAGLVSILTQHEKGADSGEWARTWPERLAMAGDAVWFYLGKLIWPYPLETTYPKWEIDAGSVVSWLPLAALVLVLVALWLKRESWGRGWFFALAYFVVALLPVVGLLNMIFFEHSYVADHFQYLAAMGPLALVGAGMARFFNAAFSQRVTARIAAAALVLLVLATLTWQKACAYENEETLWNDTLATNPKAWAAYNNIGMIRLRAGRNDEAIPLFRRALEANPKYADAMMNLGASLLAKGDLRGALDQYREALAIEPDNSALHANLGVALLRGGRLDEAATELQRALAINPDDAAALTSLGMVKVQQRKPGEALVEFQKVVALHPDDAKARNDLGGALYETGQIDPALAQFREALRLEPNYADAQKNLTTVEAERTKLPAAGH